MARGSDTLRRGGKLSTTGYLKARKTWEEEVEKMDDATDAAATIQVGDFISDLATTLRYRAKTGEPEGDWLEDPERAYTDGLAFGNEIQVASQGRVQITLSLDASHSMWNYVYDKRTNQVTCRPTMPQAGPVFQAMDKMLRTAAAELPPGVLSYSPFIFHRKAFLLPSTMVKYYCRVYGKGGRSQPVWFVPESPSVETINETSKLGEKIDPGLYLSDEDTKLAPLFKRIQTWEENNDPDATRIDIVITDGKFEDPKDIEEASRIQTDRNGRLSTVMLNFVDPKEWYTLKLPERCLQYPVNTSNLNASLRNIISETLDSMLT